MQRLEQLQDDFRELASMYYQARTSGRIALTAWGVLDRAFTQLGSTLQLQSAEIEALLNGKAPGKRGAAIASGATLCDDHKRLLGLRKLFTEIVALYAMALCAGKIDVRMEPALDAKFEDIASTVGSDFRTLKTEHVQTCSPAEPAESGGAETEVSETEHANTAITAIVGRAPIEGPQESYTFRNYATPWVLASMAQTNERVWNESRTRLEELERKPESYAGTQKEYLETVATERAALREARDKSYKIYTATRRRSRLDPDTDISAVATLQAELGRLYDSTSGTLTPAMRASALEAFDEEMRSSKFYEHFPTPRHIIDAMIDYAKPLAGERVLEPSAGEGNIASAVAEIEGVRLDVVEYEHLLADILTLKGFNVVGSDFLAYNKNSTTKYDAIIMNPPFDRGVDIQHVYHAFTMLKPGGRLVAITSGASIDGTDEVNYAFRDFITARGSWKLFAPKDYMGPVGKLTNGRSIGIVVAMVSLTRQADDTFGTQTIRTVVTELSTGSIVVDTQGSQAYEIVDLAEDAKGKPVTRARNLITGHIRSFNGVIKTGSRFIQVESQEEAMALVANDTASVNADGTISLPKLPPATAAGAADLKPLRIVTSRAELMPPAPSMNMFDEKIARNVNLTPGQMEGVNRALHAMYGPTKTFLLADGTGFGKTLQILMIAASIAKRDNRPVLVFTKSPSIIETSFFDDARKLKINTPDAQLVADRKEFNGAGATGVSIRKFKNVEELQKKDLQADIYIASYHVFGRWTGDRAERKAVSEWKRTQVDPFKFEMQKKRMAMEKNARYMGEDSLNALRQQLKVEEDNHPVMVRYRELLDIVRALNETAFGTLGRKFAAVLSDEAHAFKNYNPDDFNDGSAQAYRGMVLYGGAERGLFATATPADKVEHLRYLKGLNVYKTEKQYMRLMERLGFRYSEPEYSGGTLVKRGKFAFDAALPPEYVLNNISRLFENLTMSGTMVKRELSLDNFEAHNVMIGAEGAPPAEQAAVRQAMNQLAIIDQALKDKKRCKSSMINEKKWALEPFKIQKCIEIARKELMEGRQVIIYCSLVNDSGPSFRSDLECSAVDKPSTVNTLSKELGAIFGEKHIGFVTGVRANDEETLGDDGLNAALPPCSLCDDGTIDESQTQWMPDTATQTAHERAFFTSDDTKSVRGLSDAVQSKRADDIRAFQSGEKRILIATAEAGGTGISLDDTVGNAPRTIIIMTSPFSSVEAVQILGRINRAKTKSRQRAYFLWVNLPVDRRLRDIIASKLRVLGAAVQGEVKKVSVEEAEFASAENAQENYDKHNVDREGKVKEHSLTQLQVVDGEKLPSRIPFTLTHKSAISNDIEPVSQMRQRWRPIRFKSNLKSGARIALKEWMMQHAQLVSQYRIELLSDRYEGPYLEVQFNAELWQIMLNFLKPENTRFTITQAQRYSEGERVVAATDIIEAGAQVGDQGTITKVWQRRVRALDKQSGKTLVDDAGQIVWNVLYDYMVDFDNGERANNLEAWEIMPASMQLVDETEESGQGLTESSETLSDTEQVGQAERSTAMTESSGERGHRIAVNADAKTVSPIAQASALGPFTTVQTKQPVAGGRSVKSEKVVQQSLQDKIDDARSRVRAQMGMSTTTGKGSKA